MINLHYCNRNYHGINQQCLSPQQKKIFCSKISGAFRPGLALFFQGVAPSDYE